MKKFLTLIIANCFLFTALAPGYTYVQHYRVEKTVSTQYLRAPHNEEIDKAIQESDLEIIEEAKKVMAMGVEGAEYIDKAKGVGSETYFDRSVQKLNEVIARGGELAEEAKKLKKELWEEVMVKPIKKAIGGYDMRFVAESKPTAANPKPRERAFTPRHADEMAKAIGTKHFKAGDIAFIAGDARASRDELMDAVTQGMIEQSVYLIRTPEILPSPVVKWIADMFRIPAIQVSGSHNPADENGIKIRVRINGEGPIRELFGDDLKETGELVASGRYRSNTEKIEWGSVGEISIFGKHKNLDVIAKKLSDQKKLSDFFKQLEDGVYPLIIKNGQLIEDREKKEYGVLAIYKNMLVEKFDREFQEFIKIGKVPYVYLETGNGVAGPIMDDVFKRIGIKEKDDFEFVGDSKNPLADPPVIADTLETEKYLRRLRNAIKNHYQDPDKRKRPAIGIAFDGDGDRLEIVIYDEENKDGIPVTPERLMILGYRDYALQNAGAWIKNGEKMLVPVDVRGSSVISAMLETVAKEVREKYLSQFSDGQLKKFKIVGEYIPTGYPYNTKYVEGVGITYMNDIVDRETGKIISSEEVTVGKNIPGVQRVCPVNCEASGHAYWVLMKDTERGDIPNDDGLYSAFYYLLMDTKMQAGKDEKFSSISEAVSPQNMVKHPVTPDIRPVVTSKDPQRKFKIAEEIATKLMVELNKKFGKDTKNNNASGWRLDFVNAIGFALMRASETSSKISLKAEAGTTEELLVIAQEIDELLEEYYNKGEVTGDDWKNEIQKIFKALVKEDLEKLWDKEAAGKLSDEDWKKYRTLLEELIQIVEGKLAKQESVKENEIATKAWVSILEKCYEGEDLIFREVGKEDWEYKDLTKLSYDQKSKLIEELKELRRPHWIPDDLISQLRKNPALDNKYGMIVRAARAKYKQVIAQLEKELSKEREQKIKDLKEMLVEIVEKKTLPEPLKETLATVVKSREIIPGSYEMKEIEDVYTVNGVNLWEYRKQVYLRQAKQISRLMEKAKEKGDLKQSEVLDYIIKNFEQAVANLLEMPEVKRLSKMEFERYCLTDLAERTGTGQLFADIKKEANAKGKEYWKQIEPLLEKMLAGKSAEDALKLKMLIAGMGNNFESQYFRDFFVGEFSEKKIQEIVENKSLIQANYFENLIADLKTSRNASIDCDNAGEIYMYFGEIKQLLAMGKNVYLWVQSKDVNNDDISVGDMEKIIADCEKDEQQLKWFSDAYKNGKIKVLPNGNAGYGLNPNDLKLDEKLSGKERKVLAEALEARKKGLIIRHGGASRYASANWIEESNVYFVFSLKEEDQIADARYNFGLDPKIDWGNIVLVQKPKGKKAGNDLQTLLKAHGDNQYLADRRPTAEEWMRELKLVMDLFDMKEHSRSLQIANDSLDPVAFVQKLVEIRQRKTGEDKDQVEKEVLQILMQIPSLKEKALKYRVTKKKNERKAGGKGLDRKESTNALLEIEVGEKGSTISRRSKPQKLEQGKELADLIWEKFETAKRITSVYRDNMDKYIGRFLWPDRYTAKPDIYRNEKINHKELSDLREELDNIKGFLREGNNFDLSMIDNFISDGIGANEMYLHQLAQMINQLADLFGIEDFRWVVVDSPSDLSRIRKICKNPTKRNTLVFAESRSGNTTEPADLLQVITNGIGGNELYLNQLIYWSNGGRFKKSGENLVENDSSSAVLFIDNTPGNIGGRHMNLSTGMVYGPLFTALSILGYEKAISEGKKKEEAKEKAFEWAEEILKLYVTDLYEANAQLTPKEKNGKDWERATNNPASQLAMETLRKREVEGRVKLPMIFDPGLRHYATEHFQNWNEGDNKPATGDERNNNMLSFWDTSNDQLDYMSTIAAHPELYQPIFIIDTSSEYAGKMLKQVQELKEKGIPVKIIKLNLKKITKGAQPNEIEEIFKHNLAVQSQATALLQTMVTTFCHLTGQDFNSNPSVKMSRELNAAMQNILVRRATEKGSPLTEEEKIITFEDIMQEMERTNQEALKNARLSLAEKAKILKDKKEKDLPNAFQKFIEETLLPLAKNLGIDEKEAVDVFIGAMSNANFKADLAESKGLKSAEMEVALEIVDFGKTLGRLTHDFVLSPLSKQVLVYERPEDGIRISVACSEDLSPEQEKSYQVGSDKSKVSGALAQFWFDRLFENNRANTMNTFGLGYIDANTGNENIMEIMIAINEQLKRFGINPLPLNFPRVSHTGIEAVLTLSEIMYALGLVPSKSFPEGKGQLGSIEIRKGLTINDVNKIAVLTDMVRSALGGSPVTLSEYRDESQLPETKEIMIEALKIFSEKVGKYREEQEKENKVSQPVADKGGFPVEKFLSFLVPVLVFFGLASTALGATGGEVGMFSSAIHFAQQYPTGVFAFVSTTLATATLVYYKKKNKAFYYVVRELFWWIYVFGAIALALKVSNDPVENAKIFPYIYAWAGTGLGVMVGFVIGSIANWKNPYWYRQWKATMEIEKKNLQKEMPPLGKEQPKTIFNKIVSSL